MESLIENYLGGRHTLMYMNMTLGMYHPCKGVAREAGNDVVCYCSQHFLAIVWFNAVSLTQVRAARHKENSKPLFHNTIH